MTRPLPAVRAQLAATYEFLRQLLAALDDFETDVSFISVPPHTLHACVDFYDLREYLVPYVPSSVETPDARHVPIRHSARTFLFAAPPQPLVLLPWYYAELKAHVRRFQLSEQEIDSWQNALSKALLPLCDKARDYVAHLDRVASASPSNLARDADAAVATLKEVLASLVSRLSDVRRGAAMIRRFELLVDSGRLLSLSDLLKSHARGDSLRLSSSDSVYQSALHLFREYPARRASDRSIPNDTDAKALSAISLLNSHVLPRATRCVLFSSAGAMRSVVEALNDAALARLGHTLELRDYVYWALWYAVRCRAPHEVPQLEDVVAIRDRLRPTVVQLVDRAALGMRLAASSLVASLSPTEQALVKDGESFNAKFEQLLGDLFRPLLDARGSIHAVTDLLEPIREEQGIALVVVRLYTILDRLRRGLNDDVAALQAEMGDLLANLTRLLESIREGYSAALEEVRHEVRFCSGWFSEDSQVGEPYRELLQQLGNRGLAAVSSVREALAGLGDAPDLLGDIVVRARIHMLCGEEDKAVAAIREGEQAGFGETIDLAMTQLLWAEEKGDLERAAAMVESILVRHDNALVRLHAGQIAFQRHLRQKSPRLLEHAANHLKLAMDKSLGVSPEIRNEIGLLELEIRLQDVDLPRDARWLQEAAATLTEFRKSETSWSRSLSVRMRLELVERQLRSLAPS